VPGTDRSEEDTGSAPVGVDSSKTFSGENGRSWPSGKKADSCPVKGIRGQWPPGVEEGQLTPAGLRAQPGPGTTRLRGKTGCPQSSGNNVKKRGACRTRTHSGRGHTHPTFCFPDLRKSKKNRHSEGVDYSPMVFDTWGGPPRRREGGGKGGVCAMHSPAPAQRPPGSGRCSATGPQRATGPLGSPSAVGPDDGIYGDTGVVDRRSSALLRLHGGGQPAVVSHGQGGPRL